MSVQISGGSQIQTRSAKRGSASTPTTNTTLLSVSGPGRLSWLAVYWIAGNSIPLQVIADGKTIINWTGPGTSGSYAFTSQLGTTGTIPTNGTTYQGNPPYAPINIEFQNSLTIQWGGTSNVVDWSYEN